MDKTFKIGEQLPLAVYVKNETGDGRWFLIPSWRVDIEGMGDIDVRVHKNFHFDDGWVLSEGTTGFKIDAGWGDHEADELIDQFITLTLPNIELPKVKAGIEKARLQLAEFPCPFATV